MYKLLVTGYIRELERSLLKKIVPSDIKLLCIEYYYSNCKLILITDFKEGKSIMITDFNEDEETKNNTVWSAKLSVLPKSHLIHPTESLQYAKPWMIEDSGIACYSNIHLPKYVLTKTKLTGNHNNNVIFKCGHSIATTAKQCCAIILNDNDFVAVDTEESMKPFLWVLPSFTHNRRANALLYSKWYGLLCIGGVKGNKVCDEIMQLPFDHNENKKWEWKRIGTLDKKLKDISCVMINERTLFVCGGTKSSNSDSKEVAIYDFEIGEWIPLRQSKYARSKMGIYFDAMDKRVFCVGGNESSFPVNKSEYYDLERNQWFRLPNTSMKHGYNPLVWKHPSNNNILLIASYITNSIEMYDLRDAMRAQYTRQFNVGWSTIYGPQSNWPMYELSVQDIFKTKFIKYGLSKCNERILRFNDDYF